MVTIVSPHVRYLENSRNHVFTASDRIIIVGIEWKKEIRTNFSIVTVFLFKL